MSAIDNIMKRKADIVFTIFKIVRDQDLAEEVFSIALSKMAEAINAGKYEEKGFDIAWAKRVAYYASLDFLRMQKTRKSHFVNFEVLDGYGHIDTVDSAKTKSEIEESQFEAISKSLDLLPIEQKEIIVMRYYGEMSFKEIADVLNISINTCLGRVRYALINMRKTINYSGSYSKA